MSVASPPPVESSESPGVPRRVASDQLIEARIEEACKALWWAELVRRVLRLIVFSIVAVLLWVVMDQWIYSPGRVARVVAFAGLAAALGLYLYRRVRPLIGSSIHPEYAARSLEHDMPELRQSLTSYVTLRGDRDAGTLRSRVVKSIGSTTARQLKRHDALPVEATGTLRWWIAATCALVVLLAYAAFSPKDALQSAARLVAPIASIESPRRVSIKEVEPGDSKAIAGRSVKILATIQGLRSGEEAVCLWDLPTGRQELPLLYDKDQRKHVGELRLPHSSSGIVPYVISAGDASSGTFRLTVQDVPVVKLESVEYTPPKYTGQEPFTSSSGAIAAVDGTTVKILASTNRPVAKAKIEFNPRALGKRVQATAGATELQIGDSGTQLSISFALRSARGQSAAVELEDYRIVVWDASGQGNPDPIVYPIRVISDLPPEVSITVPASSPKEVPVNAQQVIEVHASDPDYGLKSVSLEIRSGIDLIDEPMLWQSEQGEKGHRVAEYGLRPADLDLRIGDTVEVVAVAIDNRSSEIDSNVEPNIVRTDPVTLKITATGLLPDESDPNADGLSSPEERNSESESSAGEKGGESDDQQSGGGGSGESGKQQAGGDQGEGGSSGQGSGTESSEQQSSGGGSGGESDASESDDSEGTDSSDGSSGSESEPGEGDSGGDMSSGEGDQGDQGAGDKPQPSEDPSGSDNAAGGDQSQTGDSGDQGSSGEQQQEGAGGSSESGSQEGAAGNSGEDNTGASGDNGSSGSEAGEPGSSGESQGSQGGSDGSSGSQSQAGSESQSGSGAQQAPKHDGEAFERIQEYLEKKAQEEKQGSGADQSSSGQQEKNQNESGDQSSDTQSGQQSGSDSGDSSSSSSQSGSSTGQPEGEQSSGDQSSGDQSSGDQSSGDQSSGDQSSGDQSSGDQSSGDQSSGDQSSGDQAAGDQRDGSAGQQGGDSTNEGAGGQQDEAEGSGQTGKPQNPGDQNSAERGDSGEKQGGEGDAGSEPSPSGESSDSPQDQSRSGSDDGSDGNSAGQPSAAQPGEPGESNTSASTSSGGSEGEGNDIGSAADDQPPPPPDPVNVDYAKKATDLVLDYLDQNREAPDPQLLEDLQWSKEDLQRFSDRWREVREMSQQPGESGNGDMEEALKSLGLRPKTGTSRNVREAGDAMRGIRDAGNRKPPPPAFRDAFDAFRRAVGQGK